MKAKEVHKLSEEEIALEIDRARKRIFELRTQGVTEKIADTSQFPKTRKYVAQLLTEASTRRNKKQGEAAGGGTVGAGKSKGKGKGRTRAAASS